MSFTHLPEDVLHLILDSLVGKPRGLEEWCRVAVTCTLFWNSSLPMHKSWTLLCPSSFHWAEWMPASLAIGRSNVSFYTVCFL